MKATSIVFGSIFMLAGMFLLFVGFVLADNTQGGLDSRSAQWTCSVPAGTTTQECTLTASNDDTETSEIAFNQMLTTTGVGVLVSGALLFVAGAAAGRSKQMRPARDLRYPPPPGPHNGPSIGGSGPHGPNAGPSGPSGPPSGPPSGQNPVGWGPNNDRT